MFSRRSNNSSDNNNNNNNNNNNYRNLASERETEIRTSSKRVDSEAKMTKSFFQSKKKEKSRKVVRKQKINTNVVALDLGTLGDKANTIATGDPFTCANAKCKALLSGIDELLTKDKDMKVDDDEKIWVCQLCGQRNVVEIQKEEMPQGESVDYILEPPSDEKSSDEYNIIFCVDVSGSMCVTQEMEGKIKLRGVHDLSDISAFNEDRSDQFFPGQKRDTTWISRLQSVQAAVDDQLETLAKDKPKCNVGLVTFSNEVTVIGDGVNEPEFVAGDKLSDMDLLKEIGSKYKLDKHIKESIKPLTDKLWTLVEKGQTALGPALVVSIALAAQKPGSQVIICTDGLANVGLGNLDISREDEIEAAEQWYAQVAHWALEKGVVVNVVSITDSQCKLENLGKVCDITQGKVERINPVQLTSNFKGILEKKVLATKVQATMLLHPVLRFKKDDEEENRLAIEEQAKAKAEQEKLASIKEEQSDKSTTEKPTPDKQTLTEEKSSQIEITKQIQDIGNVFPDSKIYFEYVISKELLKKHEYKELKDVVFQVQIHYVRVDGAKMLRVITQKKPLTRDKEEILKNLNMDVIAANASRKAARLCEEGDYEAARANIYSNALWMDRNAVNEQQMQSAQSYIQGNVYFDGLMQLEQHNEMNDNTAYKSKSEKKKARARKREDGLATNMYRNKMF